MNSILFGKCDFPKGLELCYDTLFAKRGDYTSQYNTIANLLAPLVNNGSKLPRSTQ